VLDLARQCDVPIPLTLFLDAPEEVAALESWSSFPAVVKPSSSNVRTPNRWLALGVRYARSRSELVSVASALPRQAFPVTVQERINGRGTGVFTCIAGGNPLVWFAHERIREKPPSGGVSVLSRSIEPDPDAVAFSRRLLERLNWSGVAMVEFKRDDRDGSLRLMEINGRLWGSLQLAIDSGVNFPQMLVDLAAGRAPQAIPNYRVGVRNRWLWGDISALLIQLTRSRDRLNLPSDHPGRLRAVWEFMHLWSPGMRYEIERLSDLGPAWLETRRSVFGLLTSG
jgi:predicted ATP-grasp superfamily ATP-dependent carboligase